MDFGKLLSDVLAFGLRLLALWLVFHFCRANVQNSRCPGWKAYCYGLMVFGIIAFFVRATYGTHVEYEDGDPIFGMGERVTDFQPTSRERNQKAGTVFVFTSIAGFTGIYLGLRDRQRGAKGGGV